MPQLLVSQISKEIKGQVYLVVMQQKNCLHLKQNFLNLSKCWALIYCLFQEPTLLSSWTSLSFIFALFGTSHGDAPVPGVHLHCLYAGYVSTFYIYRYIRHFNIHFLTLDLACRITSSNMQLVDWTPRYYSCGRRTGIFQAIIVQVSNIFNDFKF